MHLLSQHPGNAFPNKFAGELIQTAASLVLPGKGILAADESTGTIGKRVRMSQLMYNKSALQYVRLGN